MSTYGVRTRFVALLAESGGAVTAASYRALCDYAAERGFTAGELRALLRPADYLEASKILRARGVGLADVHLDAQAWDVAQALAARFAIEPIFDRLPNARPTVAAPIPAPTAPPLGGRPLPDPATWTVTTPGATVRFAVTVDRQSVPAVVFTLPTWTDPAPPPDLGPARAALAASRDLAAVGRALDAAIVAARPYLDAVDQPTLRGNARWGIEDQRRRVWFDAAAAALAGAGLSAEVRARLPALLARAKEGLLCDRDYPMEVGSHENYWPYWKNFRGALEKCLAQTAPGTAEAQQLRNRLDEIWTRKTVTTLRRDVDEKDLERSTGMALCLRQPYADQPGPRVSLAKGSLPTQPRYEVLTTADGRAAYRDGDAVYLDVHPRVAVADASTVTARPVAAEQLGLRPLAPGEPARAGVPFDWNRDGQIALGAIDISWWGHCHNEAPLNAMAIDPRRPVELYRADPRLPPERRLQHYSAEDLWDVAGALTADHEDGYAVRGPYRFRPTEVEVTKFVGSRNDGGHWILVEPSQPGARRIRIEAEVTALWHRSNPAERYPDPAARFRRDLPDDEGGFAPNPDWIAAEVSDDDEITVEALGRKVSLRTRFVTFGADGGRVEAQTAVTLDPTIDGYHKLADEIVAVTASGGRVAEHWYNPKTQTYYQVQAEVTGARRVELSRSAPGPVRALRLRQETVYDSVIDLHDFVTKNMGLPLVFDTSSGLAVWNYPVNFVRLDRVSERERVEEGQPVSYTRYRLRYRTMGGPAGDTHYIIKRDAAGNAVRAVAEHPMPDFAFRNETWVCAPMAPDASGAAAINLGALAGGYLTDKAGERMITAMWRRLGALLYVSLSAGRGTEPVRLYEDADGGLRIFDDADAWARATR